MKFKDLSLVGGKNFLRMKSGETVRGVFRGEVEDFRTHWINNRSVVCQGQDKCDACKDGEKSAFRFRINLVLNENGAYVAKTFEQGIATYEALKALHADYDLEKHLVKITRHGSGTDTTYAIIPVPNGALTKAQEKAISEVKLNPLISNQADDELEDEEESEDLPF